MIAASFKSLQRTQVLAVLKSPYQRMGLATAVAPTTSSTLSHGLSTRPRTPGVSTMPPGYVASVGRLETFVLPEKVIGSPSDQALGKAMVDTWRQDGILQIAMTPSQQRRYKDAQEVSKAFFRMSHKEKAACVDAHSYAGYIASGEEITDGIPDYSEIFTVTKDLPSSDRRVERGWPCHGPCPWPDINMAVVTKRYMDDLATSGETLLGLIELGLQVPPGSLTGLTQDGWHHLRILRFPHVGNTNGKGKQGRGIGSHTDYGLLVIAAQDDVGGLFIRPPYQGEQFANWEQSSAGLREDDSGWVYVPPESGVFTVFPGDMMQYMTNSYLPSTPHKVGLNTRERFAFAYFHEPNFSSVVRPLSGYNVGQAPVDGIHYGTHFTNMFRRNYPDRLTTIRIDAEGRSRLLDTEELRRHE